MNLYLVGYRCTGKTSVGRLLSAALEWVFVDMDHELTAEEGVPIQDLVDREGWQYFRRTERHLLERLSETADQVIATGGGVVTASGNIGVMHRSGRVVWLHASPDTIAERMAADSNTAGQRPPLQGEDSLTEIKEVLSQRVPFYEQAMHFKVNTDQCPPSEVAERILRWLKSANHESKS